MNYDYDHDHFVRKNRAMASGYNIDRHDKQMEKKGFSHQQRQEEATCFNCKKKNKCADFRRKRTGGLSGAVSFDGSEKFICDEYVPAPPSKKIMSNRQIKSLLKNARKGHI